MSAEKKFPLRTAVRLSLLVAVAMILSYIEAQIPAFVAIPGVKLGLANAATLFALYALGAPSALLVSVLRVLLVSILFGNFSSLIYSLAGALLSLLVMVLLRRFAPFSEVGVSVAGGVAHNAGQIFAACLLLGTGGLISFLPALILSGTVAGAVIGTLAGLLLRKLIPILKLRRKTREKGENGL